MANEYLVVTVSGNTFVIEEAFGDNREAKHLLASGTGDYILHGYSF
jgi:hypothetical protein